MEARIYKPKRVRNGKRSTGRLYRARIKLAGDNQVRDIALQVSDKQRLPNRLPRFRPDRSNGVTLCPRYWGGES